MTVLFGVDAQKLDKTKALKKCAIQESLRFDHVAFYFPHVGKFRSLGKYIMTRLWLMVVIQGSERKTKPAMSS